MFLGQDKSPFILFGLIINHFIYLLLVCHDIRRKADYTRSTHKNTTKYVHRITYHISKSVENSIKQPLVTNIAINDDDDNNNNNNNNKYTSEIWFLTLLED
jgi:hypothetical protein